MGTLRGKLKEDLNELVPFLQPNQRFVLKKLALEHILGLSGSFDGISKIWYSHVVMTSIFRLATDESTVIAKYAISILINVTAHRIGMITIFRAAKKTQPEFSIAQNAVENILNENAELADFWAMLLNNLTQLNSHAEDFFSSIQNDERTLFDLVEAFSKLDYNKKGAKLHYLGSIFCNLTQCARGREIFCTSKQNLLAKLIPFATFEKSNVRREGVIGSIKNLLFDPTYHDAVIDEDDQILHCLLYPLTGPEEFTDEENEKFPITLQYLGEDKVRDSSPKLRAMVLESLLQLCATKKYREILRSKGVYEILREYHKWESTSGKDKLSLLICENVVDILIKKEDEIGVDNLKEVDVPSDIAKKFVQDDENYLKDSNE